VSAPFILSIAGTRPFITRRRLFPHVPIFRCVARRQVVQHTRLHLSVPSHAHPAREALARFMLILHEATLAIENGE